MRTGCRCGSRHRRKRHRSLFRLRVSLCGGRRFRSNSFWRARDGILRSGTSDSGRSSGSRCCHMTLLFRMGRIALLSHPGSCFVSRRWLFRWYSGVAWYAWYGCRRHVKLRFRRALRSIYHHGFPSVHCRFRFQYEHFFLFGHDDMRTNEHARSTGGWQQTYAKSSVSSRYLPPVAVASPRFSLFARTENAS